jgi:hypothetical protein
MNPPKSPIRPPHLTLAEGRVLCHGPVNFSETIPDNSRAGDKNLSSAERLFYTPAAAFLLFR